MESKRTAAAGRSRPAERSRKGAGGPGTREDADTLDRLSARAMEGDESAFLDLVRFHSTFNPVPFTPELLLVSDLDDVTKERLNARLKRKEDRLMRPFPLVNMVFWGEEWVQKILSRFMWRTRGGKKIPNEDFLRRLWEASSEGAMLQLRIYRKVDVTPSAWVRVKYPHFANLGLTDAQMLKIARAEGCRFGEREFFAAVRRISRRNPPSGKRRKVPPR